MKNRYGMKVLVLAAGAAVSLAAAVSLTSCKSVIKKEPKVGGQNDPVEIIVDTAVRYQELRGFGGMSNAWNSPVLTMDDIDAMYGEGGLGYNIFRIMIYPDPAKWNEMLPTAKRAQSYGAFILASPWTPPPALKSSASVIGGSLLPENYAAYAEHLASFVRFMADNGVKINAVSLQNEPDIEVNYDSCDWSPGQMLDFVKHYGRAIGDVLVIPGESFQFRREFTNPLLSDPEAERNFDIVGGHVYGGGLLAYPLAVEKGKEVWMTEHLFNTQGNYPNDLTWESAMLVANEIHDCMEAGFSAYIWWYLKRFYSMLGDGEYGSAEGEPLRRGYVMSHYAKYAAGRQRVKAAGGGGKVLATAYEGDNEISLVIINRGDSSAGVRILLPAAAGRAEAVESDEGTVMQKKIVKLEPGGKAAALTLSPRSIVSVRLEE